VRSDILIKSVKSPVEIQCTSVSIPVSISTDRLPFDPALYRVRQGNLTLGGQLEATFPLNIYATFLGYRSGGPGSIPGPTRKKVVGLERGPLSLLSTT
jgi:hypothetical protein